MPTCLVVFANFNWHSTTSVLLKLLSVIYIFGLKFFKKMRVIIRKKRVDKLPFRSLSGKRYTYDD